MNRITATFGSHILILALGAVTMISCGEKPGDGVEASGIIETTDVTISSRAAGNIVAMKVREGDNVRAGDTLFVVDDTDLRLQKAQLLAGVDIAKYQYDLVRNGARAEDIAQAEEGMRQAKISLDNSDDDVRRYRELLDVGSISEKDYRNIETRRDVARRQYNAARLAYEKLRNGSRTEDLSAARAREEQAVAQAAIIDKKIADCVVLSPVDGVITRKGVEEGEFVNTGTGVLTVTDDDLVKLKIYVAEDELGKVKLGAPAELKIDTYDDRRYTGKVTYISPTAEFTPKNVQTRDDRVKLVFEVHIEAPNRNGDLKAGITAEARVGG